MWEYYDPTGSSCTTFQQLTDYCWTRRASNVALFKPYSGTTLKFRPRLIVRTDPRTLDSNTVIADTSHPWLYVVGTQGTPTTGEQLNKIGAYSGWTYGNVNGTCEDVHEGSQMVFCAGKAHFFSRHGDSGSPVFSWDGEDDATLYGIVIAIDCSDCPHDYDTFFSTMSGITTDLGSMTATIDITLGTPSVTPSMSGGNPVLSWSAVSAPNAGANATSYRTYRSTWDASTYTWLDQGNNVKTDTGTGYTDTTHSITINSYYGESPPNPCVYSYTVYAVMAYNSGRHTQTTYFYFLGPADGPNPMELLCQ